MEGFVFLVILVSLGLVAWVLSDLSNYEKTDFEAVGVSKGVLAVMTLVGNGWGLFLYAAHYRPKLAAARSRRALVSDE